MKYFTFITGLRKDNDLAFNLIYKISSKLLPEYKLYWPNLDYINNDKFTDYLKQYSEDAGLNTHRRWMLYQLQRLTASVAGDTVECGVYMECGSHCILEQNRLSSFPRHHYIFDSFEGLSQPQSIDGKYWSEGSLLIGESIVNNNLSGFNKKTLLKGWIPSAFSAVQDKTFSFVHIDVDLYQPTLDSIKFFYPKLNTGAILICDDYGFSTCKGATRAIDEFLADKSEKMLSLPQGGGFFIKGTPVDKGAFE